MRKIQMLFRIENFGEMAANGERQVISGYIDANNILEVLREEIDELREIYDKEVSFADFCQMIEKYDERRFGRTDVRPSDLMCSVEKRIIQSLEFA